MTENDRLSAVFATNRARHRQTLIAFLMAGDPAVPETVALSLALEKAGVDALEIGIPYSDPLADGPVLQASARRALEHGTTPRTVLSMVRAIRARSDIPVVLLAYANTVLANGSGRFLRGAARAGADALVVPDLPREEQDSLRADAGSIPLIPLVAPSSMERLPYLLDGGRGFVYCVTSPGVTGAREAFSGETIPFLQSVRQHTGLPLAAGFGIRCRSHAELFRDHCEGIIVGSALMEAAARDPGDPAPAIRFIREELR